MLQPERNSVMNSYNLFSKVYEVCLPANSPHIKLWRFVFVLYLADLNVTVQDLKLIKMIITSFPFIINVPPIPRRNLITPRDGTVLIVTACKLCQRDSWLTRWQQMTRRRTARRVGQFAWQRRKFFDQLFKGFGVYSWDIMGHAITYCDIISLGTLVTGSAK